MYPVNGHLVVFPLSNLVMTLGLFDMTFQDLTEITVNLCFSTLKEHRTFLQDFLYISLEALHLTLSQNFANFFGIKTSLNFESFLVSKLVFSATLAIQNVCRVLCLPLPVFCSVKP